MNFLQPPAYGVILMSRRSNAPYTDELSPDERVLIYEGHDAPRSAEVLNPKLVDQPKFTRNGRLTQNGEFAVWTDDSKQGKVPPAVFRVYEKLRDGIWADRGLYHLKDYTYPVQNRCRIFKFELEQAGFDASPADEFTQIELKNSRQIPSHIKVEVYKRDKGRLCYVRGARPIAFRP